MKKFYQDIIKQGVNDAVAGSGIYNWPLDDDEVFKEAVDYCTGYAFGRLDRAGETDVPVSEIREFVADYLDTEGRHQIKYLEGDATKPVGDGMKIIAHCCNNIGGWGSGFVLALNKRWTKPKERFLQMPHMLGLIDIFPVGEDQIWVANIVGQHGVRGPGNRQPIEYEAIECGLKQVGEFAKFKGASVHMPRIGCGLAGGSWAVMEEIIKRSIPRGVKIYVYDFQGGTFNP